jgi:site-specific recombinase XerD
LKKTTPTNIRPTEVNMASESTIVPAPASVSWEDAIADFLLLVKGSREEKTAIYYRSRMSVLSKWAAEHEISLIEFRARHMRQFLADRADRGVSDATRRHDAICARAFMKFCMREEYIRSDPLTCYQIPNAAKPYVKCPSDDEIRTLLQSIGDRWNPEINPAARYTHASARRFLHRRNYAVMTGLIETAARIGEMLSLRLDDYQPAQCQIAIRQAKGDEPRIIPISQSWIDAVEAYLRVRPKGIQCDRLFVSEYGEALSVSMFGKVFRGYLNYAGLSGFTLHGLRHYSITQLAKTDVWAASQIAGHKDLKITLQYLHGDPVHVREVHAKAAPLSRILLSGRTENVRRRKVV